MRKTRTTTLGLAALGAAVLSVGLVSPALADVQPRSTDVVGVGSDTVQYLGNFLADGDFNGSAGYNATNNARRMFSFDASADANGRTAYQNGTSNVLASTVVLRAGSLPVTRPNGSGSGITALNNDTSAPFKINFVRSSRLPKPSEQTTATNNGWGGLHVYQIADDGLQVAVKHGSTHVQPQLTGVDLVCIYKGDCKKWSDLNGSAYGTVGTLSTYSGSTPNDGIIPIVPQTGSGTYGDFSANLATINGGTAITLGGNAVFGEEHDPTAITGITAHTDVNGNPVTADDAVSPFSTGRYNLIQTGYLGAGLVNSVDLQSGGSAYFLQRHLYIICRDSDVTSTTKMQVGGTLNFVQTLFGTATSWAAKASNAALFTSAGVTQDWSDLGLAHS